MKNKIKAIREINPYIDNYLKECPNPEVAIDNLGLKDKAKGLSNHLENESIDYLHLALLAVVLKERRKEDLALLRYSKDEKKAYKGSKELQQLLNEFTKEKIRISSIRFDYKKLYDKKGNEKSNKTLKTESSLSLSISGNVVINRLIAALLLDGKLNKELVALSNHENFPVFKKDEYPNRKAEFIRKHNRAAIKLLNLYFDAYNEIPDKQRKILAMKTLVVMKFLESYEKYKMHANAKNIKRILAENEYYLQRYSEFTRVR
jgi:hypothetical protein